MPGPDDEPADVILSGLDAAELAAVLRWPALGDGRWGFCAVPRAAAALRLLSARRAQARLGLEVVLNGPA